MHSSKSTLSLDVSLAIEVHSLKYDLNLKEDFFAMSGAHIDAIVVPMENVIIFGETGMQPLFVSCFKLATPWFRNLHA